MANRNQTPEQKARDNIDAMLEQAGWQVQPKKKIDFNASPAVAVREYDTDVGPVITRFTDGYDPKPRSRGEWPPVTSAGECHGFAGRMA